MFEIDMEHCPNCGGDSKIIAAILAAPDIQRILEQPGLPTLGGSGGTPPMRTPGVLRLDGPSFKRADWNQSVTRR